jgi:hypothetical protein
VTCRICCERLQYTRVGCPQNPQIRQAVQMSIIIDSGIVTLVRQQCRRRSLIHVFDDDFHRFLCRCMDSELMSQTPVRRVTAFK